MRTSADIPSKVKTKDYSRIFTRKDIMTMRANPCPRCGSSNIAGSGMVRGLREKAPRYCISCGFGKQEEDFSPWKVAVDLSPNAHWNMIRAMALLVGVSRKVIVPKAAVNYVIKEIYEKRMGKRKAT